MMSAASFCSTLRLGLPGSFEIRSAPTRQYLLPAAISRLKFPVTRKPALCHATAGLTGRPARSKQPFGSERETDFVLPLLLPSICTLPRRLYVTVFPGHRHRSLIMHFSHSGLRATQV